jgi:hypothetical protein
MVTKKSLNYAIMRSSGNYRGIARKGQKLNKNRLFIIKWGNYPIWAKMGVMSNHQAEGGADAPRCRDTGTEGLRDQGYPPGRAEGGGERGIRTPGTPFQAYNGLAIRFYVSFIYCFLFNVSFDMW